MLIKESQKVSPLASESSSNNSSIDDEVLQNVKFKEETLSTLMQNKKKEIGKKQDQVGHLLGQPLSKESLTVQIEAGLKKKHEEEIAKLKCDFEAERLSFETEKEEQEKMLRDMFHTEMDNLKAKLEQDFAQQKSILCSEFAQKLETEKQLLKCQHEKLMESKEEQLQRQMQELKQDFQVSQKTKTFKFRHLCRF